MAALDSPCNFEPIDTRQIDLDHHNVRIGIINELDRLLAITRFTTDAKFRVAGEMVA